MAMNISDEEVRGRRSEVRREGEFLLTSDLWVAGEARFSLTAKYHKSVPSPRLLQQATGCVRNLTHLQRPESPQK